jgi:hypothetical protein
MATKSTQKPWFTVDQKGFRALQIGKPKHHIIRELLQNAFDENITICDVKTSYDDGIVTIVVNDDSPQGFRDITDAYTLYKDTYKRKEPEKRGRFNIGEKQAFAVCDSAKIVTTKGTVTFDKAGRHQSATASKAGTTVTVCFKATQRQYDGLIEMLDYYIIPRGIKFIVNGKEYSHRSPVISLSARLLTEFEEQGIFHPTMRKANVDVYDASETLPPYLYEMGIPVQPIDCFFSIDVGQKIPLSIDRDSVSIAFLQDLYAEVLNVTYDKVPAEMISQNWVRLGMSDERASKEAVKAVITKRFGDKVVIANPFDPIANDNALANGYNVVGGREMSKEEWGKVKGFGLMESSTTSFGMLSEKLPPVQPNEQQRKFADLAKRIARRVLKFDINVHFVDGGIFVAGGSYGNHTMTVNITGSSPEFKDDVTAEMIAFIVHELGHEFGMHTEASYHSALTRICGALVITAIKEPEFFNLK